MNTNTVSRTTLLIIILLVSNACTSQAVKTLSDQSIANNELLTTRYEKISSDFGTQLGREAEIANKVGELLQAQCEQMNASATREVKAAKAATRYRLREAFLAEAMRIEFEDYPARFDEAYAPMFVLAQSAEAELAILRSESDAASADLDAARRVLLKEREILALAERTSRDDLNGRDKLRANIQIERNAFFADIDSQLGAISAPNPTNCDSLTSDAANLAKDLSKLEAALLTESTLLEELGDQQSEALQILKAHANKRSFYKLILSGASDAINHKLSSLSQTTMQALTNVNTKVDSFINKISTTAQAGLKSATGNLDQLENRLMNKLSSVTGKLNSEIKTDVTALVTGSLQKAKRLVEPTK